jgi:hypothetical protein
MAAWSEGPKAAGLETLSMGSSSLISVSRWEISSSYADGVSNNRIALPKTGGAPTTLVDIPRNIFNSRNVRRLSTDGVNLYWLLSDNTLNAVPLTGGAPITLASALDNPIGLAAGDGYALWTESPPGSFHRGALKKVPAEGGTVATLASGLQSPGFVTFSGSNAFWTEPYRIAGIFPAGGEITTVVSGLPGDFARIATDGTNVYFTTDKAASILKVPVNGGAVENLAPVHNILTSDITTDGVNVYWIESTGNVWKVPIGGGPATLLSASVGTGGSLDIGGGSVFWFELPIGKPVRGPRVGGAVTTLPADSVSVRPGFRRDSLLVAGHGTYSAWTPQTAHFADWAGLPFASSRLT